MVSPSNQYSDLLYNLCIRFSCPVLPCPALSCPALPCPALPCPALPCPALSCPALPCPALPCPELPCPVMPCPAADMASRLDFCNFLYLCIGQLQGSTGQIWESSECGGQTRHWSSEILPHTSGSPCSCSKWRIQGDKNLFSTKEKIGKHRGVISTFSWGAKNFFTF